MSARSITLVAKLTEVQENVLVGSRAWVAKFIEQSELRVMNSKSGCPCVFICHPEHKQSYPLAVYGPNWDNQVGFDSFPFQESLFTGEDRNFAGISLTKAGKELLSSFARKCKTLLKYRLRKQDVSQGRLCVKLIQN